MDGDNFRVWHTPLGWFSMPQYYYYKLTRLKNKEMLKESIHIRLAGVDAPESGAFGMPKQPYADEAKSFLRRLVEGKRVVFECHRRDQYQRVVCSVWKWHFIRWLNVSLEMIKSGWAVVYTAAGAEYGDQLGALERAQERSKKAKRGLWQQKYITLPGDHKKKYLP
jgi:endonuclease YncB( thermonuclease family)